MSYRELEFDVFDRIDKALRIAGITRVELATRIGVSRPTITRWLTGYTPIKRKDIAAIAMATGVPFQWLATGEKPTAPPVDPEGLSDDARSKGLEPPTF